MSDIIETNEAASVDSAEVKIDESIATPGTVGDEAKKLSLRLYVVPHGDDTKADYVLAVNQEEARRGAVKFFGAKSVVGKAVKTPALGHRVLVQVQERESQPDHLGFVFEEWSKEHLESAIV